MKKRWLWLGAIALCAIILITIVAAPSGSRITRGSTYSRSPDGYGAWYAFMEKQGTPVKRWQKPFKDLPGVTSQQRTTAVEQGSNPKSNIQNPKLNYPITLLRVNSQLSKQGLNSNEEEWIKQGNTMVILGVLQPVTKAAFSTQMEGLGYTDSIKNLQQTSQSYGTVKIDTRRRRAKLPEGEKRNLGDRFGAVVWEEQLGNGRAIYATTPYLAANAYQNEPGNYKFLAQLVTQTGKSVWVDEYIHGYRDQKNRPYRNRQGRVVEQEENWLAYLSQTPLGSLLVQAGVILLVLIWASNRRFGPAQTQTAIAVDNSEAYIQALAGVLQKANSSEFVLEVVGKQEQLELQKALGLGTAPVDDQTLINAWVQQTGRPAAELEQVLQLQSKKRRISDQSLLTWLDKWQKVRS